MAQKRFSIMITGIVQGVGFRPYVYKLAQSLGLDGWVLNSPAGVECVIEGEEEACSAFLARLPAEAPPASHIDDMRFTEQAPLVIEPQQFVILPSKSGPRRTLISPDLAICQDCLAELFDPVDRRYRYPFINCTNCGPRFTIIEDLPYDRPLTTMKHFAMCHECRAEYENPAERRFHAQPNACARCGPALRFLDATGREVPGEPLELAALALRNGQILAVKGLGGYHLACDAQNEAAVNTLRGRKLRWHKPFALMLPNVEQIRRYCELSPEEEALLSGPQRPIVLLRRKKDASPLPAALAPDSDRLGVMLPYTPLHYLLMSAGAEATNRTPMEELRPAEDIAWDKTDAEYWAATDLGLVKFAENIINEPHSNEADNRHHGLGQVDFKQAADIKNLTGINTQRFKQIIRGRDIRHINNRHGIKGLADNSMADLSDVGMIQYVLKNYENIQLLEEVSGEFMDKNNRPAPLVRFKKQINGSFYVTEVVPDTKTKTLVVISAYRTKKRGPQALNMPVTGPQFTPEAPHASASNQSIAEQPGYVNSQILVMTSANFSDEPIAYDDDEALTRLGGLGGLADAFLLHDRPIFRRADDSVAVWAAGAPRLLRRSRGYAPQPLRIIGCQRQILALGGQEKNTFCLTRGQEAILSQHMGELSDVATYAQYRQEVEHFCAMFKVQPELVACDLHPDYISTRYAEQCGLPLLRVQHHHAHLASVLAEHNISGPALGFIFDGSGYGEDGNLWGGEVLYGDCGGFKRLAHLRYLPLPGGEAAIREPWRQALSALYAAGGEELVAAVGKGLATAGGEKLAAIGGKEPAAMGGKELAATGGKELAATGGKELAAIGGEKLVRAGVQRQWPAGWEIALSALRQNINAPLSSGMGRLFDALAAIGGLYPTVSYEGQAAIALEHRIDESVSGSYSFDIHEQAAAPWELDWRPLVRAAARDIQDGKDTGTVATRFHRAVAELCLRLARRFREHYGVNVVALSGGCWQNIWLLNRVWQDLRNEGFAVYSNSAVPVNDGGLAFGQAAVGSRMLEDGG